MRTVLSLLAVFCVAVLASAGSAPAETSGETALWVTSAADETGTCPHPTQCTLRSAIAAVNGGSAETLIRFAPAAFPAASPATITIGGTPLPALTRDGAAIDGNGAGVIVRLGDGPLGQPMDGIRLSGAGSAVRHLRLEGFTGRCVLLEGAGTQGDHLDLHGCATGVELRGPGAALRASSVTATAEPGGSVAVHVAADGAVVGGAAGTGAGNTIAGGSTGILVAAEPGVEGATVEGNTIADVGGPCLQLEPGSTAIRVVANAFARCGPAIGVAAGEDSAPARRSTFHGNTFSELLGLAIDLGGDGIRNLPGGVPPGANDGIAPPVITRATPSSVRGRTCPGCEVELYLAQHEPGGLADYGTVPLGPTVAANDAGDFETAAAVSPGQWIIATATDGDGNTSEFGLAARVGAGSVLCGNVQLQPGWNHVAFFGPQPLLLADAFPSSGSPAVVAIYQAIDGTLEYRRWLAATSAGRTLTALEPGKEYWLLATSAVTLPGGFSVAFPVPVDLQQGWNDLTYIGGTADPRDALQSIAGKYERLARWDAAQQRWLRFDDGMAPAWALDLTQVDACGVYQVYMREPGTLLPLQP